jgi:16S rRNA C1402 N4-methylase RsmH
VKAAFRSGLESGVYASISADPQRASWDERTQNPRSRSAKLRWGKAT